MDKEKSEMEQFLGDIPTVEESEFGTQPVVEPEKVETEEVAQITPRDNREARRAKAALQVEREANIALNATIAAMTEAQKFQRDTQDLKVDESLLTLYGSDDNGRRAAEITQRLLEKTKSEARDEAFKLFQEEQRKAQAEVGVQEKVLDGMLEEVEDEFDVDLTSNTAQARKTRQAYLTLLEEVSPKDREGNVKDYADPITTFKILQSQATKSPEVNRAKDLSSRSMVRAGASSDSKLEATAQERFLKEAGII